MALVAYYNEFDPHAAQWLRNLIAAGLLPPGEVDERSIVEVKAAEVAGYTQCHFFAGIGGWSHALRLAGWADNSPSGPPPVHANPSRSLDAATEASSTNGISGPLFAASTAERHPPVVFGEQVARSSWTRMARRSTS